MLHLSSRPSSPDNDFSVFAHRRPFTPALRELELGLCDSDCSAVLKAGFSDVVLHTLTGSQEAPEHNILPKGGGELSSGLLPGLEPLVFFEIFDSLLIELREEHGRIRRLQGWTENHAIWKYLSTHYNFHKTVPEIRIGDQWDTYAENFKRYPQLQDGITFVFKPYGKISDSTGDEKDYQDMNKIMYIPGLAKVEFAGARAARPYLSLKAIVAVLGHIELPTTEKVEIYTRSRNLLAPGKKTRRFRCLADRFFCELLGNL
ncbi:hypothetical protein MVEN_01475900 [Mycena venus]|uniref:Uncharacterized protein n=1 Tax=Mycena venus TaxID=2733690 RepID=A0A8H6XVU0_9AGAR|nr:hypothetical protein MVEN_01475900 [Mycena venus]